jgi:phosphatidylinositol-3,4,5-trisphosphate 3-phosphatase/dual-specificity protein phosphatase PTEN
MVSFIREMVSGTRRRFVNEETNLDLTYITSRLIVMSYPSHGFEKIYRNSVEDVSFILLFLGCIFFESTSW